MARNVFDYETVAILWADQYHVEGSQRSARSPGAKMFFDGDTIYSYGEHFPIARIHGDVVLFTASGHSVTTEKHKRIVWNAARRRYDRVFTVDTVRAGCVLDHERNLRHIVEGAIDSYRKASRARKQRDYLITQARRLVFDAEKYAERFGLDAPVIPAEPHAALLANAILALA